MKKEYIFLDIELILYIIYKIYNFNMIIYVIRPWVWTYNMSLVAKIISFQYKWKY